MPGSIATIIIVDSIPDDQKRKDTLTILELMEKAMKEKPKMLGSSIIGFGDVRYMSPATAREVDWFKNGFSPRKANLLLHLGPVIQRHAGALGKLGKHKTGVGCLYINKLKKVDVQILETLITTAAK